MARAASADKGWPSPLAEALFSGIHALGFREIDFELTPHGAALGLAEALPSGRLELRASGYGRGESASTRHSHASDRAPRLDRRRDARGLVGRRAEGLEAEVSSEPMGPRCTA